MNAAPTATAEATLTDAQLRSLDVPGPRYTSYPTADRFVEAFGPAEYRQALRQRAEGAVVGGAPPLSLYVHIPFCDSLCYYCACNKIITKHHDRAAGYLELLAREIELHVQELGRGQGLSQLHLGGGTPTFLSDEELAQLMGLVRGAFRILPQCEVSIEVDPRTATRQRLRHLAEIGFNRVSFGVQDFDADVQSAVHRVQSYDSVQELVHEARALKFESINADLIYGLPRQTPESFSRTIAQVCALRPTRIALYAYAHLPQRFKPQRRIAPAELPTGEQRVQMLGNALAGFVASGYVYIGMDHFALPDDALAVAKRQGRLHRNFQGYTTQPDCDLIGLGVSAIGRVGATYSQNAKTLSEYEDALAQNELPVVRGLALTRDDLLRRSVIMGLMCQGRVEYESVELAHLIDFRETFAPEFERLKPLEEMGLVEVGPQAIQVTATGWYFVRAVAMTFDRYLQSDKVRERFSRII
ncbi:MAG: oxygen-independent coproporphyrinogen III oxidase [Rubrivivax sp.]|jgi:oxygen-independent coproporphyrinogen-3 oxidase|nr:oxygen-independent coproporphyrinogen III oxidase [Betaproteobacteria bacterium]MBP6318948.1 oxygen-independent coproporphyrinogen III oxidase [Rubrivivax sp.]MBK7277399.1 oxygen-independent coproporphyrinogen III oxidase [Betaproteobacteria bacterium]MBK7459384.1 oxygen-independent coproporphyrinogen III oxidase [Betaproteobacteria bacterium]MBK7516086.1 oxygen-independent coproporphyrinogen III oxidase [Betaproteobacteria bacterium]